MDSTIWRRNSELIKTFKRYNPQYDKVTLLVSCVRSGNTYQVPVSRYKADKVTGKYNYTTVYINKSFWVFKIFEGDTCLYTSVEITGANSNGPRYLEDCCIIAADIGKTFG